MTTKPIRQRREQSSRPRQENPDLGETTRPHKSKDLEYDPTDDPGNWEGSPSSRKAARSDKPNTRSKVVVSVQA
jgi:hypothetical protein